MPGNACHRYIFLILLAAVFSSSCAQTAGDGPAGPGTQGASLLQQTLALAGENASALQDFVATYPQGSEEREAAMFLAVNLPAADAATMTADQLREHVDYAFLARRSMPWGQDVPWDIFLRSVLPHRTAQEPTQPFRKRLFSELAPPLGQNQDMAVAALKLALWCQKQFAYVGTSRRDQGPLTTLTRGQARCEEAVVLYVAAARSIGIPARLAIVPAWQFTNDNHAWVEVWINGSWHYLDPANPSPRLDWAWFTENAANALYVVALSYGPPQPDNDASMHTRQGATLINRTAAYTRTYPLRIAVLDAQGAPLPDAKVFVSTYNYGTLKPVTRVDTGEDGTGSILLGKGVVMLTVQHKGNTDFGVGLVQPGPNDQAPEPVQLDLRRDRLPGGRIWMRFTPWLKVPAPEISEHQQHRFDAAKQELSQVRQQRHQELEALATRFTTRSPLGQAFQMGRTEPLLDAGENLPELLRALDMAPASLRSVLDAYTAALSPKDRSETTAQKLLNEAQAAQEARNLARTFMGMEYPDAVFKEFVLPGRITHYEPYSSHKALFLEQFRRLTEQGAENALLAVNRLSASLRTAPASPLAGDLDPLQVLRGNMVTSQRERGVFCTALLRSIGIPARYLEQWGWVEYHLAGEWLPLYPARPQDLGNKAATTTARAVYGQPALLEMTFTLGGEPAPPGEVSYFKDFAVSRFAPDLAGTEGEHSGHFASLEPDPVFQARYDKERRAFRFRLPEGRYFLTAARRNQYGEPLVHIIPVAVKAGSVTQVTTALDMPGE
jgi:hypothetical protein